MMENKRPSNLQVFASPKLREKIDKWRRVQEDIPNLSEAVRRLIDIGLRAEEKEGG